jgi:iron complex transport system permease protein
MYESVLIFLLITAFLVTLIPIRGKRPQVATPRNILKSVGILAVLLLAVFLISIHTGPTRISAVSVLKNGFFTESASVGAATLPEEVILFSIRLPRILLAAVVGSALSVAGVVFQGLLRNPLADPYILGISGGAAVGAIIGILAGVAFLPFGISGLAFAGALLTMLLVFGISRTKRERQSSNLLLSGVIVNTFFAAMIILLISTARSAQLRGIFFWLMGDLSLAEKDGILSVGLFLLAGFILIYTHARALNLMAIDEETAMQLGVNVERTKGLLLAAASLITAAAVSVSGTIGFVGLMIPHMMRMQFGPDHRLLLPASLLFGASFLVAADTIARSVASPNEMPVGVVTALCGAPYFIYLLRRKAI